MTKAITRRCLACALYIRHASSRTPDSGFMAVIVQRKPARWGTCGTPIADQYQTLFDGHGVGGRADSAGRVHRCADSEHLVHAVGGAVGGQVAEPPQLAQGHPELADEHVVQESE